MGGLPRILGIDTIMLRINYKTLLFHCLQITIIGSALVYCAGKSDFYKRNSDNSLSVHKIQISDDSLVILKDLYESGDSTVFYAALDSFKVINCSLYTQAEFLFKKPVFKFSVLDDSTLVTLILLNENYEFLNIILNTKLPSGTYYVFDPPIVDYRGKSIFLENWFLVYIRNGLESDVYSIILK